MQTTVIFKTQQDLLAISKWYMFKNKNFESENCFCVSFFSKDDIVRETEKAILVRLPMVTKKGRKKTKYVKSVWLPKVVVQLRNLEFAA